jgi:release factor glutamine methyltransferase
MPMPSVAQLIKTSPLPRHEFWALLEAATGQAREHWIAHDTEPLSPRAHALLKRWIDRRVNGVPLAYLVGWREFYGRRFWVNPTTLIPRSDTELLIDTAVPLIQQALTGRDQVRVGDLGTGSGCIALTLALECPRLQVVASDLSTGALQTAANNAAWWGLEDRVRFYQGDWWQALPAPTDDTLFFGLISNPPYIGAQDPHLGQGDLQFEPPQALRPTNDPSGLAAIRQLLLRAPQYLEPGGFFLVEHGFDQQAQVINLARDAGFNKITGLQDAAGLPRAVLAFRL